MLAAAVQMTSTEDPSENLTQAHHLMIDAIAKGAELVAFPEMFTILTDDTEALLNAAETLKGTTVATFQEWAAENDLWILSGSLPIKVPGDPMRVTNTSLLIDPEGEIVARYDKIHLFDVDLQGDRSYEESKTVKAGKKPVTAELPVGRAGLSVCYDLRFPELYREYARKNVSVLFIPSAFTAFTGKAHWDVLTRARAIENQAYVIAPAQTGTHYPGRTTHGHTRIIDPWGRVIAERPAGPGVVLAPINTQEIERVRQELPALSHRQI